MKNRHTLIYVFNLQNHRDSCWTQSTPHPTHSCWSVRQPHPKDIKCSYSLPEEPYVRNQVGIVAWWSAVSHLPLNKHINSTKLPGSVTHSNTRSGLQTVPLQSASLATCQEVSSASRCLTSRSFLHKNFPSKVSHRPNLKDWSSK